MNTHQHLTTIAEFMGWEYDYDDFVVEEGFIRKDEKWPDYYPANSFDTMRMVFDKWRQQCKKLADCDFRKYVELLKNIERSLCSGTPSDCAARLAEAIEWWKSVK